MAGKFFEAEATEEGDYVFHIHRPRMFDEETREHLMEARKHALQAMRHVVDAMLTAMEKREGEDRAGRRQNIDID